MNISDLLRSVFTLIGIFAVSGVLWGVLDEKGNKGTAMPIERMIGKACGWLMVLSVIGVIICGFLWVWGVS